MNRIALICLGLLLSVLFGCSSSHLEATEDFSESTSSQRQDKNTSSPSKESETRKSVNTEQVRPGIIEAYQSQTTDIGNTCAHISDPYRYPHCQAEAVSQTKKLSVQRFWDSLNSREKELIRATENYWRNWYEKSGKSMVLTKDNFLALAKAVGVKNENEANFVWNVVKNRPQEDQANDELFAEICRGAEYYGADDIAKLSCNGAPR